MEIKPGWYRMRNGEIAYVAAVAPNHVEIGKPCVGWTKISACGWCRNGLMYSGNAHSMDLIEPLPSCTGFDWTPEPKYVPFTRETYPRDAWIEFRSVNNIAYKASGISDDGVKLHGVWYTWDELLKHRTIDGKPAGRLA